MNVASTASLPVSFIVLEGVFSGSFICANALFCHVDIAFLVKKYKISSLEALFC